MAIPDGVPETFESMMAKLAQVNNNCRTAMYSLDDVNNINDVIRSLKIHARMIYECCS